jgi:MFS transporter, ACS family, glucarate transporter
MTNPAAISNEVERSPYRWVILTLCWAAYTMTATDRGSWGPAAQSVGHNLGVAIAGLGVFATGYYIGYVIANAGSGFLCDWLGPRMVLGPSLAIAGVFMILFGGVESVALGIAFQFTVGLFGGCDYAAGVKLLSRWFPSKDHGFTMGIFLTGTSLGTVIANAVVPRLIAAYSWRASYQVFGAVTIVIALLCVVLLRNGSPLTIPPARTAPNLKPLARSRDLWLIGLAGFGGIWGTLGFSSWANTLMTKGSGISPIQAGTVVVIFGVAAVAAKPCIGSVSDLFFGGRRKTLTVIVFLAFFASLLVFGTRGSLAGFLWAAPFLGVAAYAYSPLMVAMLPRIAGVGLAGSAAGATNAMWQLAATIVPTVVGAVFAASGSFFWAFATLAAGPLLGMACMLAVREPSPAAEPARKRRTPILASAPPSE